VQERFNDETPGCMTVNEAAGEFGHRYFELAIVVLSQRPEPWPGGVGCVVGHHIAVDVVQVAHALSKDTCLAHVVQAWDIGSADPVQAGRPWDVLITAGSA